MPFPGVRHGSGTGTTSGTYSASDQRYLPVVNEPVADEHGRPRPPQQSGEVATLLGFLDYQRATLEWKCQGLGDEQLRVARPPSSMSLGGL